MRKAWFKLLVILALLAGSVILIRSFWPAPTEIQTVSDPDAVAGLFDKQTLASRLTLMQELVKQEDERFRHIDSKATTFFSVLGLSLTLLTALGGLVIRVVNPGSNTSQCDPFLLRVFGAMYGGAILFFFLSFVWAMVSTQVSRGPSSNLLGLEVPSLYGLDPAVVYGERFARHHDEDYSRVLLAEYMKIHSRDIQANNIKASRLSQAQSLCFVGGLFVVGVMIMVTMIIVWGPPKEGKAETVKGTSLKVGDGSQSLIASLGFVIFSSMVVMRNLLFATGLPVLLAVSSVEAYHVDPCRGDSETPQAKPQNDSPTIRGKITRLQEPRTLKAGTMMREFSLSTDANKIYRVCYFTALSIPESLKKGAASATLDDLTENQEVELYYYKEDIYRADNVHEIIILSRLTVINPYASITWLPKEMPFKGEIAETLRGRVWSQWADNPSEELIFGLQYWNTDQPGSGNPTGRASSDVEVNPPYPLFSCCAWGFIGGPEKSNPYSGWYQPQTTVRLRVKDKELMDKIIKASQDLVGIEVKLEGRTITAFKILRSP